MNQLLKQHLCKLGASVRSQMYIDPDHLDEYLETVQSKRTITPEKARFIIYEILKDPNLDMNEAYSEELLKRIKYFKIVDESPYYSEERKYVIALEIISTIEREFKKDLTREGVEPNPGPGRIKRSNTMRKKKNKKNSARSTNLQNPSRSLVVFNPRHIVPDRIRIRLRYIDGNLTRTNSGALYLVYALTVNNPSDVDPLILSGSVTGFKEWLTFYYNWRVISILHKFSIVNNEAFAVLFGLVTSTKSVVSLPANRDAAISFLEGDNSTGSILLGGSSGQNRAKIIKRHNLGRDIVGNLQVYMSDNGYEGFSTNNITLPISSSLIVASTGGSNLVNGVSTSWVLDMDVEFYNRVPLSD